MANTPRLKADGLLTLDTLVELIDEGVIKWWNNQYADEPHKKIEMHPFRADYIKDLTGAAENRETNRIITFRKIRLAPGGMGSSPFSGTKELRPRHREDVIIDGEGHSIWGKWRDVLLRFDCFAPTWTEATRLEEDFEDLMDLFSGPIMKAGLNKMLFQGSYSESFGLDTDYYYEPVTYWFRLEKQYVKSQSVLREAEVFINNTYQRIITSEN